MFYITAELSRDLHGVEKPQGVRDDYIGVFLRFLTPLF